MKRNQSIKLKAIFLLIVFSLSTVVSFACATGIDMGYNKNHHNAGEGKSSPATARNKHSHSSVVGHEHRSADMKNTHDHRADNSHWESDHSKRTESTPDDCCRDEAAKFEKCDKLTQKAVNFNFQPDFIILFIKAFYNAEAFTRSLHHPNSRYLTRNHHPPIPDTRIAIQSFLI
ncbi:HYC_CC_PP family protein [Daejeonella lutea]|uniref:Lipoprotein n=1 Tax=Daejeonella lutea TaxID=572036 RepID=A0A1T5AAZ5_9SPHI|nr:hypothetical protein [Daejeonella lutea]SKB32110.1 hypothetical protein SAMN05661099_0534 [Daejeonella lutea]